MLEGFWGKVFLGTVATLAIGACREVGIELDPSLSKDERERVQTDLKTLERLKIDPSKSRWFSPIFLSTSAPTTAPEGKGGSERRGTKTKSVIDHLFTYLDDRIHYLLTNDMQVQFDIPAELENSAQSASGFSVAQNVGTSMYYQIRMLGHPYGLFEVDGKKIPIRSTRVGLIQLGDGFTKDRTPSGQVIDSLFRVGTLVHEARHSDCSGGLPERVVIEHRGGLPISDRSCGHIHTICPPGHEYAGNSSCEAHPWGAYAVEAVLFQAVAEACEGCSSKQKQAAKLMALDRLSRLDEAMAVQMFSGKLGQPKMTAPPEDQAP